MVGPEIRTASDVEENALQRFYVEMFPERAAFLGKHWRWLYRVGHFPGVEPLVLIENDRVVGHAGAIPLTVARLGRSAPAIWFVDFAVAPAFQGQGHGRALTEAWMKMCPDRVTFCNDRSMRVFLKLGWSERCDASARRLPLELSGPARARGPATAALGRLLAGPWRAAWRVLLASAPRLDVRPLPNDAEVLAKTIGDCAPAGHSRVPAEASIVRDANWARWRLLDHPSRSEHRLAELGGVSAILRLFTSRGRRRAHLLYVGPGTDAARAGMIAAFARWAVEQGADDAWMATNDRVLLAAGGGRLPLSNALRFASHSDDAAVGAALSAGLPTQGLDSDCDLMFPCS